TLRALSVRSARSAHDGHLTTWQPSWPSAGPLPVPTATTQTCTVSGPTGTVLLKPWLGPYPTAAATSSRSRSAGNDAIGRPSARTTTVRGATVSPSTVQPASSTAVGGPGDPSGSVVRVTTAMSRLPNGPSGLSRPVGVTGTRCRAPAPPSSPGVGHTLNEQVPMAAPPLDCWTMTGARTHGAGQLAWPKPIQWPTSWLTT